jgi:hypothetical protein
VGVVLIVLVEEPLDLVPELARERRHVGRGAQCVAGGDPVLLGGVAGGPRVARAAKDVVELGRLARDVHPRELTGTVS